MPMLFLLMLTFAYAAFTRAKDAAAATLIFADAAA